LKKIPLSYLQYFLCYSFLNFQFRFFIYSRLRIEFLYIVEAIFLYSVKELFYQHLISDKNLINFSENAEVDVTGLPRGGTRYSSTSSLNSVTTASSPQALQSTNTTSNIHNQAATAGVVCQTQDLNLARSARESPPASSIAGTVPTPSISTPAQVCFLLQMMKLLPHHIQDEII